MEHMRNSYNSIAFIVFAYKHIIEPTNEQASVRWNKIFALTYTPTDSKLYIY